MQQTEHDRIIDLAGGTFGKFQKTVLAACMISYAAEGFLVYNMVYLCMMPVFSCNNLRGEYYECSNFETCSSEVLDFRVEKQTLHNWVQDFDIRCTSKWLIGLYGSSFFIGRLMGNMLLAHFGDSIGRI